MLPVVSRGHSTNLPHSSGDRKGRTLKNKEELPPNLSRGPQPTQFCLELETELAATEGVLRPQATGLARGDQPALTESPVRTADAMLLEEDLMELIFHPSNLDRAWRRV